MGRHHSHKLCVLRPFSSFSLVEGALQDFVSGYGDNLKRLEELQMQIEESVREETWKNYKWGQSFSSTEPLCQLNVSCPFDSSPSLLP